ncbi:MAG: glycosyltransferase family 4 protein [Bacteroidetes bacterium]|nr:glycosyltransferase family 4 protein [Bacteroidota bacterium]
MNVALVHYRLSKMGGLESRMRNYLDYFVSKGVKVTLFCYKHDDSFFIPKNVEVVKVNVGLTPKNLRRWAFNKKLKTVFNKADFDFSLTMERTSQQHASIAPGDHLGFMKAMGIKNWRPKHWAQVWLDKQCFNKSEVIYPCSDLINQNLERLYGINQAKMCTLYPPIKLNEFDKQFLPNANLLRQKFNISATKFTFVMASVSHKRKGVHFAVELFKQLPKSQFELKIAGLPKLDVQTENIEFLGYVPNVAELYHAADALIHPAYFEPAGQIVAQALHLQKPVLISNQTGWAPKITPEEGMVVKNHDLEYWKKALMSFVEQDWQVPEGFGIKHHLGLEAHMNKMLSFFDNRTNRSN